ncbi:MAG: tRNA (adenosine(37)-N6)-threonylcarbamoyltransferase complex ATPase subunit type 1 TsaE [Candidatus Peribacteraceae bacterium]
MPSDQKMRLLGASLAHSLYRPRLTIDLVGDLGAGKTTFVQGLAHGLRIETPVTSPTFALEERHDDRLCHIDLCRLNKEASEQLLRHSDDFPGIRVIEWANRSTAHDADLRITIDDVGNDARRITIECRDVAIPTDQEIHALWDEVALPQHIRNHITQVSLVTEKVCKDLLRQCRAVRPRAVRAAALLHDLLRFVDFRSMQGDEYFIPDARTTAVWQKMKEQFGTPHEPAAARLLTEQGFPDIARIVSTHRGKSEDDLMHTTIEQQVLAYADKRVDLDKIVSLDERFHSLIDRHQKNASDPKELAWQESMRLLERNLLPDGLDL